jgi:hypothetical protein
MGQVGENKSHLFLFLAVIAGYLLGLHGAGMWLKTGAAKAMTAAGGDGGLQGGKIKEGQYDTERAYPRKGRGPDPV